MLIFPKYFWHNLPKEYIIIIFLDFIPKTFIETLTCGGPYPASRFILYILSCPCAITNQSNGPFTPTVARTIKGNVLYSDYLLALAYKYYPKNCMKLDREGMHIHGAARPPPLSTKFSGGSWRYSSPFPPPPPLRPLRLFQKGGQCEQNTQPILK